MKVRNELLQEFIDYSIGVVIAVVVLWALAVVTAEHAPGAETCIVEGK